MDDVFSVLSSKLRVFKAAGRGISLSKLVLIFEMEEEEPLTGWQRCSDEKGAMLEKDDLGHTSR